MMFPISRELFFLLIAILTGIVIFFFIRFKTVTITEINFFNIFRIPSTPIPWAVLIPFCIFIVGLITPIPLLKEEIVIFPKTETKPLVFGFGYADDFSPVSRGIIYEYCSKLEEYLENETKYNFKTITISNEERFENKKNNLLIYCDANTITSDRQKKIKKNNGKFSSSFFTNGAAMMITLEKNNNLNNQKEFHLFNKNSSSYLKNQKLGVLKNTTTYNILKQIYPSLELNNNLLQVFELEVFDDINNLYKKLEQKKISGYVSDQVLLKDFIIRRNPLKSCYKIIPENHWLSYEEYGVIVYKTDEENGENLLKIINKWVPKNPLTLTKEYEEKYTMSMNNSCTSR